MSFKHRLNVRAYDDAFEKLLFLSREAYIRSERRWVSDILVRLVLSIVIDGSANISPFSTRELRGRGRGWGRGRRWRRSAPSIAYAEGGHVRDRCHIVNFTKYQPKSGYTRLHWPLHLALSNCQPMGITIAVVHHRPRAWHAGRHGKRRDKRVSRRSCDRTACSAIGCSWRYSLPRFLFARSFATQIINFESREI